MVRMKTASKSIVGYFCGPPRNLKTARMSVTDTRTRVVLPIRKSTRTKKKPSILTYTQGYRPVPCSEACS
jgi:hypothetical protein